MSSSDGGNVSGGDRGSSWHVAELRDNDWNGWTQCQCIRAELDNLIKRPEGPKTIIQLFWFICNLVVELPKRQLLLSLKQRPCEQNNVLCLCYDFFDECANVWSFLSSVFQLDKMIGAQVPKPACWFSFRWNAVKKISVMTETEITRSRTTTYGQRSFSVSGPSLWNSLPLSVRDPSLTMTQFCTIWRLFCFAEHTVLSIVPSWQFRL